LVRQKFLIGNNSEDRVLQRPRSGRGTLNRKKIGERKATLIGMKKGKSGWDEDLVRWPQERQFLIIFRRIVGASWEKE